METTPQSESEAQQAARPVSALAAGARQLGLVALESEGDAALSDEMGALFMHRKAEGVLHAIELFPPSNRLVFEGSLRAVHVKN